MVVTASHQGVTVLTLTPNRSANARQNRIFFFGLVAVSGTIALAWTVMGVWLVLPFAGIELGLVGYFLSKVYWATQKTQSITLADSAIEICEQSSIRSYRKALTRSTSKLSISEVYKPLIIEEICLFDDRQRVEVGGFLNREDKQRVINEIKQAGIPVQRYIASRKFM